MEFLQNYIGRFHSLISSKFTRTHPKRTLKDLHKNKTSTTFIIILNQSTGLGMYSFPFATHLSGWVYSLVLAVFMIALENYCVYILIKLLRAVEQEKKVDLETYDNSVHFLVSLGPTSMRKMANPFKYLLKIMLVGYPLGVATLYIVYVGHILTKIFPLHSNMETSTRYYVLLMLPSLIGLNCIKKGTIISGLTHLSLGSLFLAILLAIYQLSSRGKNEVKYKRFGKDFTDFPLLITSLLLSYEAIATTLTAREDMKNPEKFSGLFGVVTYAAVSSQIIFILIGGVGYWRYGDTIQNTVINNFPSTRSVLWLCIFLSFNFLSAYPQACYPLFNTAWYRGFEQYNWINSSRFLLLYEYLFRIGTTILTVILACLIPRFQTVLELIGSLCISGLVLFFPAMMDFIQIWRTSSTRRSSIIYKLELVKDVIIMILAMFITLVIGPLVIYSRIILNT